MVKLVLMYGCETWTTKKNDEHEINVFRARRFRRTLKIRWQDRITNKEVLQIAEMENLSEDVKRLRRRQS